MDPPPSRGLIYAGGRVFEPAAYRPSSVLRLEDTVAWWTAVAAFGFLLVAAGTMALGRSGTALAIGGVVCFLATAVVAGSERFELATVLAIAGVVLTSIGISIVLGTDPSILGTAIVLLIFGAFVMGAGAAGGRRAGARERLPRPT